MPRERKNQTSLPLRWEWTHGAFYYRVPASLRDRWGGKTRFRLGATLSEAYRTWHAHVEPDEVVTISDAIARYAREVVPDLATRTQSDYQRALDRLLPVFGAMAPADLLPVHVYQYMDRRARTVANRDRAVLSAVMNKCVRWGLVSRNLVREVERNKETPRDRYVTDAEFASFRRHCSRFLLAYLDLKMLTGLRQGQLLALTRSAWNGERLVVPGVKRGKTVSYYGDGLAEAIEAVIGLHRGRALRSIFLFATRSGGRYTGDGFRAIWRRAMTKFVTAGGLRFTEHDLRAKVASDSESLGDASDRLGHRSSAATHRVYRRKPTEVSVLNATKVERKIE